MKHWGLHTISYLSLLATSWAGNSTAVLAAMDHLSPKQVDRLNPEIVFVAQALMVLEPGSTGAVVKDVQAMLALMGYYSGAVDGNYTQAMSEAVRKFQADAGLVADGVVGPLTWQRLLPTPAILTGQQEPAVPAAPPGQISSNGASEAAEPVDNSAAESGIAVSSGGDLPTLELEDDGASVRRLQTRLADLDFYSGPIDGVFGSQTELAVQQFQRQVGLGVDGIVGPATWRELLK